MPSIASEKTQALPRLLEEIRSCRLCAEFLPLGPRPVVQVGRARLVVAAQAPGLKVHQTGRPFNDPSGERLRAWMGIGPELFYNPDKVTIIPMGFCYPGRAPRGGDLPPRPECAQAWRQRLFDAIGQPELTLVIGQYAQAWHLGARRKASLTETVRAWRDYGPTLLPMPHPSPRNNLWLRRNAWFEAEVVPWLRQRVADLVTPEQPPQT